ncbi:MAG: TlpA disulfide reductase family protein [Planctomycetota bacterium]
MEYRRMWLAVICAAIVAVPLAAQDEKSTEITVEPKSPLVGKAAPEIQAPNWLNTNRMLLADCKGKVVVLEFWATWCPPCREAIPHMVKLHGSYKDKGVVFIGLTSEENLPEVGQFVEDFKIPYAVGVGSKSSGAYGESGIPHVFLIDPAGVIAWDGHPGNDSFDKELKKLVSALPAPAAPAAAPGAEGDAAAVAADNATAEVIAFLKDAQKNRQKITGNETEAADFFAKLNGMIGPFVNDPKVIREVVNMLNATFRSTLGKGSEIKDLCLAVLDSLVICGQFSDAAADGMMEAFNTKYSDVHLTIKGAAIAGIGKIRTVGAVENLITILPKICPYPEEPNPYIHHRGGDDVKSQVWTTLNEPYYNALYTVTGEKQVGDAFRGVYWRYSQWKNWIQKNRATLAKKFAEEKKKALGQ